MTRLGTAKTRALHKAVKRKRTPAPFVKLITGFEPGKFFAEYPRRLVNDSNERGNWRKHSERQAADRVVGHTLMKFCTTIGKAAIHTVTMTRLAPTLMDSDGAVASCKHLRDGIADWIGRGDGPDCGIEWIVKQEKSKAYGVRVDVWA